MRNALETKQAIPFISALLVFTLLMSFYPFFKGVLASFYSRTLYGSRNVFAGLENYLELFNDDLFWQGLKNSLIWTFSCVGLEFIFGMGLALLLNLKCIYLRSIYRSLILLPWATPPVVVALIWRYILSTNGPLNTMLRLAGLNPPSWLLDPRYALLSCIMVNVWLGLPFMTVMLLAGLQAIPPELYEAASIDGANAFKRFIHITLPMMKSVISVVLTLMFIWTFNMFDIVYVLTNGGPGNASLTLSLYGYQSAFMYFQPGYGAAIGVISLLILLIPLTMYLKGVVGESRV